MDQVREAELFERLKSLEIATLAPRDLQDTNSPSTLFSFLQARLKHDNISPADLEKPLSKQKRAIVQHAVDYAILNVVTRRGSNFPAASTLGGIASYCNLLLSATRPQDLAPDQAKDFHQRYFRQYFSRVSGSVASLKPVASASIDADAPAYCRILDTCANIAESWRLLPAELDGTARKEGGSQAVFNALGKALGQYRAMLEQLAISIQQKDILFPVTKIIYLALITLRKTFKEPASKFPTILNSLGAEKVREAEGWIEKTFASFEKSLRAAGGTDVSVAHDLEGY